MDFLDQSETPNDPTEYVYLLDKVEQLQAQLMMRATGGNSDGRVYRELRLNLLNNPTVGGLLPRWVKTCRDLDHFWEFIKAKFPSYAERREFIRNELQRAMDAAARPHSAADAIVGEALDVLDPEHVRSVWDRALQRRATDPEGAITLARTLVETVCKHILNARGISYGDEELPKLYKAVADALSLHPTQHTNDAVRRILGGCTTVVEGLGTLRNRAGDAHGNSPGKMRPAPRHAELAVNLAGAMAQFLVSTWQARDEANDNAAK